MHKGKGKMAKLYMQELTKSDIQVYPYFWQAYILS